MEVGPNLPIFASQLNESTILQPVSTTKSEKKKKDTLCLFAKFVLLLFNFFCSLQS